MAAAALVQGAPVHPALPAGPPGLKVPPKPSAKTPVQPTVKPPAKSPATRQPPPPVVTQQPAAVALPPLTPGQPHVKHPGAAPKTSKEEVHLTARPEMTPEKQPDFGDVPVVLTCPQCFHRVKTKVELENGRFAMCVACCTCASVVCCCFFWVPLYSDYFKDLYHVCPQCGGILYERKPMG
ncbi:hypothetical protein MRX96_050652 [Rhipicephalus microplus]